MSCVVCVQWQLVMLRVTAVAAAVAATATAQKYATSVCDARTVYSAASESAESCEGTTQLRDVPMVCMCALCTSVCH